MKKIPLYVGIVLCCACLFYCCSKERTMQRDFIKLAKQSLQDDNVTGYNNLKINCVDTISDLAYAKLSSELLSNMEVAYEEMLYKDDSREEVLTLYLNEIRRTRSEMDALIDDGDLQTDNILLYMVTASYNLNNQANDFIFMVNPDKKTLHTLDPFGNNLLYKE